MSCENALGHKRQPESPLPCATEILTGSVFDDIEAACGLAAKGDALL